MADPETDELAAADADWRELDQDVNPRTLSAHGRRRLAVAVGQAVFFVLLGCATAWGAWQVLRPMVVDTTVVNDPWCDEPLKEVVVIPDASGVLPDEWVKQTMKLPKRTAFLDLDLFELRDRLLANGQVRSVELRRRAPGTLEVTLVERTPVLRVRIPQADGRPKTFLVARDGVVYEGFGYAPQRLDEIPYLAGVRIVPRKRGGYQPIDGMDHAAGLVLAAQQHTPDLFRDWTVVNLGRLATHDEIVVRARDVPEIVFTSNDDYAKQLGYLSGVYQRVAVMYRDVPLKRIDLSLSSESSLLDVGRQVPVTFAERPAQPGETTSRPTNPRIRRDF